MVWRQEMKPTSDPPIDRYMQHCSDCKIRREIVKDNQDNNGFGNNFLYGLPGGPTLSSQL